MAIVALGRCAMLFATLSFVQANPHADKWVTDRLRENMADILPLLNSASGLSLLFFSVASEDSKRY